MRHFCDAKAPILGGKMAVFFVFYRFENSKSHYQTTLLVLNDCARLTNGILLSEQLSPDLVNIP